MKLAAFVAALSLSVPSAVAGQARQPAPTTASPEKVAEAYAQFLIGHHYQENDDDANAIIAFKRAMELDPLAAEIPAELADLYMRQNKAQDAIAAAEQAIRIAPANRQANRVLGIVYAALAEGSDPTQRPRPGAKADENLARAIRHLELAIDKPVGEADPNVRASLSRLYVRTGAFDKAIPLLTDLVNQEPGWQDGPLMLAEAFAGAGRTADAIAWLEPRAGSDPRLLPTLADFYERERRWPEAAAAYGRALQRTPRNNAELKTRYASALINAGGRENVGKARDALVEVLSSNGTNARALYLLSQSQRQLGEVAAAEATARRLITQNGRSPWGYYALAEALEERRQFQAIVDVLAPAVSEFRTRSADASFDAGLLLPHLGFAYQEVGQHDKAIASFEEARKLAPKDPAISAYLIQANIAAKKFGAAVDAGRAALTEHPDDLRLIRLHARALRHNGKADQGITLLEGALRKHADEAPAHIALAQAYSEADRGPQAVKVLQDAQTKFPADNTIAFELGAVFDKQKKYAESEAAFRQVLSREPDNAAALNYLGYMLAERGERLDESVGYLKKALQIEPDNGSFLDSLGWAYFKSDKLELAEQNLKRAAEQLTHNSVIQDHYGDVLFKLSRYDEAIAAFTRALAGDGDSIVRGDIDKKIKAAKQKLGKK